MSLESLYQKTILEYAGMKQHNRKLEVVSNMERGHNPSCGDDLTLLMNVKDGMVEDISFLGKGCAISTASTNMMIEAVKGKKVEDAQRTVKAFFDMMAGKELSNEEIDAIGDAEILEFTSGMPARIKCATLSWHSLDVIVNHKK